ncbi:hypothetical protein M5K25_014933 [Dendrobium thyrsiflorum]|uniref:Uncharacterized protein n=1 Tax=Dendrobium thyrsiflorum TaxID=117978 RepID=A0ABD0UPQ7_DENTH
MDGDEKIGLMLGRASRLRLKITDAIDISGDKGIGMECDAEESLFGIREALESLEKQLASLQMDPQNILFTVQLRHGASIQLANAAINTENSGATIRFGGLQFFVATVRATEVPVYGMETEATTSRMHLPAMRATARDIPHRRTSVFERLSQLGTPTTKRVIARGRISTVTANTTVFPREPVTLGRHDAEASSYGGKLIRRQRRKKNAELRAHQPLSAHHSILSAQELEVSVPTRNKFTDLRWVKRNNSTENEEDTMEVAVVYMVEHNDDDDDHDAAIGLGLLPVEAATPQKEKKRSKRISHQKQQRKSDIYVMMGMCSSNGFFFVPPHNLDILKDSLEEHKLFFISGLQYRSPHWKILLHGGMFYWNDLQQRQRYEREAVLTQIDHSRKTLFIKLEEYNGEDLEIIHEAAAFARENAEQDGGFFLPQYPTQFPDSFVVKANDPSSFFDFKNNSSKNSLTVDSSQNSRDNESYMELTAQSASQNKQKRMRSVLGFIAKSVISFVGIVSALRLAGFKPEIRKRDSSINLLDLLPKTADEVRELSVHCPSSKVLVIKDGKASCLVKERVEVPFGSDFGNSNINIAFG